MSMNNRLLRPIARIVSGVVQLLLTISGEEITDLTGDTLRTIQNA